ncbi:RagB/SusD family nutrient uptake outer membrane protein [Parapedobacter sp. DT-150]|uniref:RagB/SusD family nutrient uptake outer membrane protein n=1 Tax=Parapedobacter sp. DT-150 TaxID=3396162 RepID=UPI003F1DE594
MNTLKTANKRYISKVGLLSLLLMAAVSCSKDLLEPDMLTSLSDASAFDTPDRIEAQVNGLYASMKDGGFYGGRLIIYNELRADEFIMNKPNIVTGQQTWLHSVNSSTSEVNSLWSNGYATINRVNTFLEGLEINRNKISDELYANYAGEAKFVRALSYFALLQMYAKPYVMDNGASPGLPLRLNAERTSANNELARSSVAEVYAQILSDLDEAEAGLPNTQGDAVKNTIRAHKNTAIALKMRVYLVRGEYSQVVTEGNKIVSPTAPFRAPSGVENGLEGDITAVFGGSYAGSESVFSLPFTAQETPGTQNQLAYYFNSAPGNAEFYLNPLGTLSDPTFSASSTDARKNLVLVNTGQKWLSKYKVPSTFSDWIPVIRYADVLLMQAEALARTSASDLSRSVALLNAVRQRSDSNYEFAPASTGSQEALINTILQERKIELLGEGARVPDLLRLQLPLPGKSSAGGISPTVDPDDSKYIWPMSGNEMAINKLCEPNP